ncbi:hypothetical protein B0I18_10497 [Taibaiella chishuiensis]|uniref:Uncharacterized protein n=1 Tax=Taibaiella chishuiensis TaxID=1434707 RepID=A0A2P8D456_9BACT|nr:hypothetical protein B0I18_10497 [Taibaiella chishuiensis]
MDLLFAFKKAGIDNTAIPADQSHNTHNFKTRLSVLVYVMPVKASILYQSHGSHHWIGVHL